MRVVIAEDHALLRDGLIRLLDAYGFEVVEAVDNGPSLLPALTRHRPDVAIVDVRLPPTFTDEGLQAAIEARRQVPCLPILVLSQHVEQLYARELLADRGGAVGYLLKDRVSNVGQFIDAVRRVARGGTVMDPEVVSQLLTHRAGAQPLQELTAREREVLGLMAEGAVQCRHRRPAVHHRESGQQAHQQHLHQAADASVRRRQPAGACGAGVLERVTAGRGPAAAAPSEKCFATCPPHPESTAEGRESGCRYRAVVSRASRSEKRRTLPPALSSSMISTSRPSGGAVPVHCPANESPCQGDDGLSAMVRRGWASSPVTMTFPPGV